MVGVIESGSTVVVEGAGAPRRGEIWGFTNDAGVIVVHRVREVDGDHVTGRGSGNPVDDPPVPLAQAIGRVTTVVAPDGSVKGFGTLDRLGSAAAFRLRRVARTVRRRVWSSGRR